MDSESISYADVYQTYTIRYAALSSCESITNSTINIAASFKRGGSAGRDYYLGSDESVYFSDVVGEQRNLALGTDNGDPAGGIRYFSYATSGVQAVFVRFSDGTSFGQPVGVKCLSLSSNLTEAPRSAASINLLIDGDAFTASAEVSVKPLTSGFSATVGTVAGSNAGGLIVPVTFTTSTGSSTASSIIYSVSVRESTGTFQGSGIITSETNYGGHQMSLKLTDN